MKFRVRSFFPRKTPFKKGFAAENPGRSARFAALAAKLAATRHGCSTLGTFEWHQRGAALLAESRATAVCRLAVGAIDRPRETARIFAFVTSGRHAVTELAGSATMPPAMTIVLAWAVVIVIVMMPAMATTSVVTTQ